MQDVTVSNLPGWLQPYVEKVYDPEADGHCGYRSVAVALGCQEGSYMAIKEAIHKNIVSKAQWYQSYGGFEDVQKVLAKLKVSETPCPKQHWMGMPSMGQAIANTWFRPVFFYSKEQTSSFLPAFAAPN